MSRTARQVTRAHKAMTLSADEFIRRFFMHVLPSGVHRIPPFGPLAITADQRR